MNAGKVVRWTIFSVGFSLIPFGFVILHQLLHNQSPSLAELIARGDLLLISVAISADALGTLIGSEKDKNVVTYLAGGGCGIALTGCSFLFGELSLADPQQGLHPTLICLGLFCFALVASAVCKWHSGEWSDDAE